MKRLMLSGLLALSSICLARSEEIGLPSDSLGVEGALTPSSRWEKSHWRHGLPLEIAYQDSLRKVESEKAPGVHLIVLGDRAYGTGLDLGSIDLAAKTLAKNLNGRVVIKHFEKKDGIHSDEECIRYLLRPTDLKPGERFRTIHWYGHGDGSSLWIDARLGEEARWLDSMDTNELTPAQRDTIKTRFTSDAFGKLYTCHSSTDMVQPNIAEVFSDLVGIPVIGANSWVFIRNTGTVEHPSVYCYPATREDYRAKFDTLMLDQSYTGESRWERVLPVRIAVNAAR